MCHSPLYVRSEVCHYTIYEPIINDETNTNEVPTLINFKSEDIPLLSHSTLFESIFGESSQRRDGKYKSISSL